MRYLITIHRTLPFLAALAGGLVAQSGGAAADDESWHVSRVSGQAWTSANRQPATAISAGMEINAGVTIFTAERARVMLVSGQDTMLIGPKSIVAVSPTPTRGLATTVLQRVGSVTYDVEKQDDPHFSVETPMMAAVVKGTRFTVMLGRRTGALAVDRGVVGVTALATGQMTDVTAGQRADVNGRGLSVSGAGRTPSVTVGKPQKAVVAPVTAVPLYHAFTAAELSVVTTASTIGEAAGAEAESRTNAAASPPGQGSPASNASTRQNDGSRSASTSAEASSPVAAKASQAAAPTSGVTTGQSSAATQGQPSSSDAPATNSSNTGPSASDNSSASNTSSSIASSNPASQNPAVSSNADGSQEKGQGNSAGNGQGNGQGKGQPSGKGGEPGKSQSNSGQSSGNGNAGKSDNGKGNGGTPGNGKGRS